MASALSTSLGSPTLNILLVPSFSSDSKINKNTFPFPSLNSWSKLAFLKRLLNNFKGEQKEEKREIQKVSRRSLASDLSLTVFFRFGPCSPDPLDFLALGWPPCGLPCLISLIHRSWNPPSVQGQEIVALSLHKACLLSELCLFPQEIKEAGVLEGMGNCSPHPSNIE